MHLSIFISVYLSQYIYLSIFISVYLSQYIYLSIFISVFNQLDAQNRASSWLNTEIVQELLDSQEGFCSIQPVRLSYSLSRDRGNAI